MSQIRINVDKPYKIYAEYLEQGALDQFESAMREPYVVKGALMPDAHSGYSLPIGAVVATKDVIVPAWVGYDIGCGMCAMPTTYPVDAVKAQAKAIFDDIYKLVPVGFSHNVNPVLWGIDLPRTKVTEEIYAKNGALQMGSLGGGNHFIEIGQSDLTGSVWIIVHSGSRGIGHAVATHYMKLASGDGKAREGHYGFDVNSQNGKDYIMDMKFCLGFALENRKEMINRVNKIIQKRVGAGSGNYDKLINRNHNHAELKDGMWVHRKGATHAEKGMMGVIPGNMRDGSFIVCGKGCEDALWSSSHGAGRVLGRKEAKRTLNMEDFKNTMGNVTARVESDTLDESPAAYKDIFDVMRQQSDMVDVMTHIKPIINIKG